MLCCGVRAAAQSFPALNFTHLTSLDGLSSDLTTCAGEDRQGFIWIGTANGLNRYDGYRIKQYFHDANDSSSLCGNEIHTIHCDSRGRLWIVTSLGVSCFYPESNRFVNYSAAEPRCRRLFHVADMPDIYEGRDGVIWIMANKDELWKVRGDMTLERVPVRGYLSIRRDIHNQEWAIRDSLLFRLDERTKRPIDTVDFGRMLSHHPISHFTSDVFGRYWVSCWDGNLWLFDPAKKALVPELRKAGIYREPVVWSYENKQWLLVPEEDSGLWVFDPATLLAKRYSVGIPEAGNLLGAWFKNAFVDRSGTLWMCTDKGVNKVGPKHTLFDTHSIVIPDGHDGDVAALGLPFGFTETDSLYWISVRNRGTFLLRSTDLHTVKYYTTLAPANSRVTNQTSSAYSFFRQGDDLYISTDSGLVKYGLDDRTIHCFFPAVPNFEADFRNIVPIDTHTLWIRTWDNGIFVFDLDRQRFARHYLNKDSCIDCLPYHLNWLIRTRSGKILLTANGGVLIEYDPLRDAFIRRQLKWRPEGATDSIPIGNLYGMAENDDGTIWLCSRSGVLVYDPARQVTERVFTENGQMGEAYRICFDDYHNAWINGLSGIWSYERASGKWIHFSSKDGLPAGDAEGFMAKDSRGHILCGIRNALIRFYPSRTVTQPEDRPVIITEAALAGKNIEFALNNYTAKQLILAPGQSSFTLDFAVLNYDDAPQDHYYYRLDPMMKNFEANVNGHLNFTGLAPGTYQLQVKGGDKFGNIFPAGDKLTITVRPFFYQTTWFRLLVFMIGLGSIGLIAARIIRNIRQEADLRQKISESEMMALRAQMNPHFIFNCLTSIDNLIQNDQKEKATTYLAKFARLIRAILENSKKETIPCWKDLEALRLYLEMESLRLHKQFCWSFTVDDRIVRGDYKIPPMILQPFVENAIHHGLMNKLTEDKQLRVQGELVNSSIRFTVEDNGVGRIKAAEYKRINKPEHQSMGMEITLDRINYFNHDGRNTINIIDLYQTDGSPAGTRIEIWINNQN